MKKVGSEPFLKSRVALVKAEEARVDKWSPINSETTPATLATASILVPVRSSNITSSTFTKSFARTTEPKEGTRLLAERRATKAGGGEEDRRRREEFTRQKRWIDSKEAEKRIHSKEESWWLETEEARQRKSNWEGKQGRENEAVGENGTHSEIEKKTQVPDKEKIPQEKKKHF